MTHAPTNSGVMRGWLGTLVSPEAHKLWFVLSSETLAYYESPEAEEPLGMLGIDEMRSVRGARARWRRSPPGPHCVRVLSTVLSDLVDAGLTPLLH